MSKSNILLNTASARCHILRPRQPSRSKCSLIVENVERRISSLSSHGCDRKFSTIPSHSLSTYAGSFPKYHESSFIQSLHPNTYNSTTLFPKYDGTSRTFASRRRGGPKGKKANQGSNILSNEALISRLLRDAAESSADNVTVRLVTEEGPDTPSSVEMLTLSEAIVLSLDRDLDLIEASITGDPPVIRATQLSKLEYKQQQAQKKQQQAASNKQEKKSFRFKAGIESNDLERKLDRLKAFLSKGHDCDFTVFTRLRTLRQNPNAGAELVEQIQALLSEHGDMKRAPQTDETKRFYRVQYEPKK